MFKSQLRKAKLKAERYYIEKNYKDEMRTSI